jgi:hypothetical protein
MTLKKIAIENLQSDPDLIIPPRVDGLETETRRLDLLAGERADALSE